MDQKLPIKLEEQLCFALYRASRAMTSVYRPVLEKFDLTYPQYIVMLVLWEEKEISFKGLCERLYLDSGTLSPLIKRLERRNLLKRTRCEDDERGLRISLQKDGKKIRPKVEDAMIDLDCRIGLENKNVQTVREKATEIAKTLLNFENKRASV